LYNILFYEDENANKPVEKFIDELDAAAPNNKNARVQLEQIIYCLNRLEEKTTQKTPLREIAIAERRMEKWLSRK